MRPFFVPENGRKERVNFPSFSHQTLIVTTMKQHNNISAFVQLITATHLAFLKNSLRVVAWTLAIGLFASLASQTRAETTTQTIQVAPGTPTVTIIVTSTTPVTVTATTAQPAQYNTGAGVQSISSPDSGKEYSFSVPKAHGPNMFFTLGPTFMHTSNEAGSVDLYGLTLAFGFRLSINTKIQIDSSLLGGSHDEYIGYYYHGHVDYVVGLDAFSPSFIIPFDEKGIFEIRLSPSIGLAYIYTNYRGYLATGYYTTATDGKFAVAAGSSFGLTFHTSKRFMLDLGFRYMRIDETQFNWGIIPATNTYAYTFSAGWKF